MHKDVFTIFSNIQATNDKDKQVALTKLMIEFKNEIPPVLDSSAPLYTLTEINYLQLGNKFFFNVRLFSVLKIIFRLQACEAADHYHAILHFLKI